MLDYAAKRRDDGILAAGGPERWLRSEFRDGAVALLEGWKLRSRRAHIVHYENLIRSPDTTLRAMLDYLEVEEDPGLVADMLARAAAPIPELAEHRTSPDVEASVGRWRRDLSPALREICREQLDDILREFGYEADDEGG
jgi:hypothetical protein